MRLINFQWEGSDLFDRWYQKIIHKLILWNFDVKNLRDYDISGINLETILSDMGNEHYQQIKTHLTSIHTMCPEYNILFKIDKMDNLRNIKNIIE